ncbi:MAG: carbohydrate ABC transporter permease [Bacilli bacterium]
MEFAAYDLTSVYTRTNVTPVNKKKPKFLSRSVLGNIFWVISTLLIWLGVIWMIFPYFWMFASALKTPEEIIAGSAGEFHFWSQNPQWGVFKELFETTDFLRAILNTCIIEVCVIPVGTFTSSLAAFAFAKMKFKFKKTILITLMTSMMIPYCAIMFTQFQMFQSLGMVGGDSPFPLLPFIIPGMFSRCSMIFFLTTHMKNTIHDSLIESARIDGASFFRIFIQIALPLVKSAIAAQVIFWFVAIWNDYFAPSIYIGASSEWKTLQVLLMSLYDAGKGSNGKDLMFAGSFIGSLPMIVFFLIFRNMFVKTTALSGVKE